MDCVLLAVANPVFWRREDVTAGGKNDGGCRTVLLELYGVGIVGSAATSSEMRSEVCESAVAHTAAAAGDRRSKTPDSLSTIAHS